MLKIEFSELIDIEATRQNNDYADLVVASPQMELSIPAHLGAGTIYTCPLIGGAGLVVMESCFNDDIEVFAEGISQDCLSSTLCLKGSMKSSTVSGPTVELKANETLFARYVTEQARMTSFFKAKENCCFITLQFGSGWLNTIDDSSILNTVTNPQWQGAIYSGTASNMMLSVAHEILQAVKNRPFQEQFLSAKAMELWSHHVSLLRLLSLDNAQLGPKLKRQDVDAIHKAAKILVDEMDDPPDIISLSHRASINDNKLKKGFKQVYGITAFTYLQQQRLKKARALLLKQQFSVVEVAAMVGFKSRSHFSKVFKQYYGISPKQFKGH
ncbi:MAG: AraC family transcriptional regulator [Pseudomonadota bacterium]